MNGKAPPQDYDTNNTANTQQTQRSLSHAVASAGQNVMQMKQGGEPRPNGMTSVYERAARQFVSEKSPG